MHGFYPVVGDDWRISAWLPISENVVRILIGSIIFLQPFAPGFDDRPGHVVEYDNMENLRFVFLSRDDKDAAPNLWKFQTGSLLGILQLLGIALRLQSRSSYENTGIGLALCRKIAGTTAERFGPKLLVKAKAAASVSGCHKR